MKRNYFTDCFLSHFCAASRICITLVFAVCLLGVTIARADTVFTSALNGNQAVPATNSSATGVGSVILNDSENKVIVTLNLNGLQNTQSNARVHAAAPRGATAGVIFSLPAGVSTKSYTVTASQVADLKAGLWYFNVTSPAFPNGEIRGQIDPLCSPPPENMKSWYQAENVIKDSTGNYNALPSGNVSYAAGKVGQSFKFNGVNQHVFLRDAFDYNTFTVSMWVNPGETQIASATLVDNSRNELANWSIEQNQNGTNFYSYIDKGGSVGFSLEPNVWQHLTIVRAENGIKIYRDGVFLNWMPTSLPVNYSNGQNLWLARRVSNPNVTDRNWNGQIDEFATFNRVLSETEIRSLYYSGSAGVCTESAWMPTARNGKILFYRSLNNGYQIFTINNDGSNLTNLTNMTYAYDFHPAFSPDNSRIAFTRSWNLYSMNADGSNKINQIGAYSGEGSSPRYSPDGRKISFTRGSGDESDIYVMDSNGTNLRQLTYNSVYDNAAKWSPDSTKIVFVSNLSGGPRIYTMNADGSNNRGLTSGNSDGSPSWSPDGSKIAFRRNWDIYVMKADGSGAINLTNTPTIFEGEPEWAPDGTKIIFTRNLNNNQTPVIQLSTMNPDGSGQTPLVSEGLNYAPMWQAIPSTQNVTVSPASNINVTFAMIAAPGRTVATLLQKKQMPPLPSGYAPGSPIYDIRTSASYMNFVTVSFNVAPVANSLTCSNMRLMHFTDGEWVEYNNSSPIFNAGTCTVSQNVSSLSPFMVAHINPAAQTASLSGNITYGTTPAGQNAKFVSNVSLTTTGASFAVSNTGSDGSYRLENLLEGGQYTVTPSKSGGANGISTFDATLVLRHIAAGNGILTPNQRIAADTNNSGTITSFDATQILRYVAAGGQTGATGEVGSWKFTPPVRNYNSLFESVENENYEAILIGEVNGNWIPPQTNSLANADEETVAAEAENSSFVEGMSAINRKSAIIGAQLLLGTKASRIEKGSLIIPVLLTNNSESISGFSVDVVFDSNILELDSIQPIETTDTLTANNFSIVSDTTKPGRIGIAASGGADLITANGTLIKLRFKVKDTAKMALNQKTLTLSRALLENN
ncbi:MAG TPA: CHRD domain-containing protein [Pyrinomonadaceae bacterium]|jgi:TolB protein